MLSKDMLLSTISSDVLTHIFFHNEITGGIVVDLFLVYHFSLFPGFRLELIYAVIVCQ